MQILEINLAKTRKGDKGEDKASHMSTKCHELRNDKNMKAIIVDMFDFKMDIAGFEHNNSC